MSRLSNSFARRVEAVWYADKPIALLVPLAWLFRLVVWVRRRASAVGLLRRHTCGVPVVIVGNITVGGAGKTPLVGWIANRLRKDGCRVGILSRGYGGTAGDTPTLVSRDSDVAESGDEALLLAHQTDAIVCVCADRVAGARMLVEQAGVDLIVCDDGLQHYRLQRDLEIVVVDGSRGLGNGQLLPAGPLREPAARLEEVDFIFTNGESSLDIESRPFTLCPDRVRSVSGDTVRDLSDFRGQRVWAVAGIGNPGRFLRMLRDHGILPEPVDLPDHGSVSLDALRATETLPILMTAKDAVKYRTGGVEDSWYIPVDLVMSPADEGALTGRLKELYAED
ncbi:MAG: tetraacyldisaccharide 4'-kinase [Gammaproteobacteria bacterium]|nr:tetraacyldisaccharide 4'-kinase [Gammaproteobacteria bacterium]NND36315.1 tetraacyldisaccharide 4'-kinase [Gammaproteobacteria bacterium]